jgi:hypothetical protein
MKKPTSSKTNFKKLEAMKDSEINFDDIPELDEAFFKNAQIKLPEKQSVTKYQENQKD